MEGDGEDCEMILGNRVEPIEKCYDKNEVYQSVVERYYSKRYSLNVAHPGEDYCVLFHSNRVCVVTLAPSHPIRKLNKTVANLNFQISANIDRLENKVSGKSKHGAQRLDINSALCFAECSDGTVFKICAAIPGKLVEINELLLVDPNLIVTHPEGKGFIAIVLPSIPSSTRYKEELLTHEQYLAAIDERQIDDDHNQ